MKHFFPIFFVFYAISLCHASPERGFTSRRAATDWQEALVTGNGQLGAMIFGQPTDETIILNHGRLYLPLHKPLPPPDTASILPDLRRTLAEGSYQRAADMVVELANKNGYSGKHWTDPFIPACDLRIGMKATGEIRNYSRSVDFTNAMAQVIWSDARGQFTREVFSSRADNLIALRILGPGQGLVDCTFQLANRPASGPTAQKAFKEGIKNVTIQAADGYLNYRSSFARTWPGSLQGYEVTAKVVPNGGTIRADGPALHITGADSVVVLLRIELLPDIARERSSEFRTALSTVTPDFEALLARHAALHGKIFGRAQLDLNGGADRQLPSEDLIEKSRPGATSPALLEKLYDAARYTILCASGDVMPNLQGIWTGTWNAPWSGDFTMNGNLQVAMAANMSANMAENMEPYFRFLESHMPAFRENARRLYGCRGIHVPSRASTHGFNNHFDATWPMTFWTAGAAWAAHYMYDYYLYSGDMDFLRKRALPFMKECALFYEDFLLPGPDGKLLFSPSYSPENAPSNSPSQACINATMDISAAKELLQNLITVCEKLNLEAEHLTRWRHLLAQMPTYQVNQDGALKEWTTPQLDDQYAHRHCSHLYAIYHGMPREISSDPALLKAFATATEKRMEVRRKEADGISLNGRPPGEMAFGIVYEAMASASLRQSTDCGLILEWLANRYWRNNLVSTHNPKAIFNTDICGGLPEVVNRMLIDSQPGWIELLPALPQNGLEGTIRGLRARGQIEVQALTWNKKSIQVTLLSEIHQPLEVRAGKEKRRIEMKAGEKTTLEFVTPHAQ